MKNTYTYLLLLTVSLLTFSCKKHLVEDKKPDQTPVFKVEGTLGTESFSLKAGDDNFLMSSFIEQINGVDFFAGSISNGTDNFSMGFFNGNIDLIQTNVNENLGSAINFTENPTGPLLVLSKNNFPNSSMMNHIVWSVNGTSVSQDELVFNQPGKYNVGALVTFNDGTSASISNDLIVGFNRNVKSQLRHFLSNDGDLKVWIEQNAGGLQEVKWFLDNNYVGIGEEFNTELDSYGHKITAEIRFANGSKRIKSIWVDGGLNGKFIDDFSSFEDSEANFNWDFTSKIQFTFAGNTYESISADNSSSEMLVNAINYYGLNSLGKAVYKIDAHVNCMLRKVGSSEIVPLNAAISFAIEID